MKGLNNYQSQPSLQQTPLDKHQSATANDRPGKLDKLSQHVTVNQTSYPSMQSAESYPSMYSKGHCIEGVARAQNSGSSCGSQKNPIQEDQQSRSRTSNYNTPGS